MNTPTTPAAQQGNEPAKNTVLNPQSTKPVAAGTVSKVDPDNDASKQGTGKDASDQAIENKARATELAGTSQADKDRLNDEVERLRKEKDGDLSVDDQKEIDALHGDTNNAAEDPEADHRYLHADPHGANDSLRKDMEVIHERDGGTKGRLERFVTDYKHPIELITQLVRDVAADTPDEHIVWGASGHILRFGHLRALVMGIDRQR